MQLLRLRYRGLLALAALLCFSAPSPAPVLHYSGRVQAVYPEGVLVRCDYFLANGVNSGHTSAEVTGNILLTGYSGKAAPGSFLQFNARASSAPTSPRKGFDGGPVRTVVYAP